MLTHHVTTVRLLPSILRRGLLCSKSRGKLRAVWLCCRSLVSWALLHVAGKRRVGIEQLVVLTVRVGRRQLSRRGSGLWFTTRDVPPEKIVRLATVGQIVRADATHRGSVANGGRAA